MLTKPLLDRGQDSLVFWKVGVQSFSLFWIRRNVVEKWRVVVGDTVFTLTQKVVTELCTRDPVGGDEMSLVYISAWGNKM